MNNELIGIISNEGELKGVIEDDNFNVMVQITESGPRGPQGNDGYTPIKGIDYFDGTNGQDGHTPIKGVDYFDGEQGAKGEIGITGEQGLQGLKGDKGDKGDQGVQGIQGEDGASEWIDILNKPIPLDKFTEVEGQLLYNGAEIGGSVPNLTLTELTLGGRFKIFYNDIQDSLDIEVI